MHKIAFLFPGQGAQYVGMGKDFFDQFEEARKVFEEADEVLGFPFSRSIFEGPQAELTETKNSQPAIYVMSVALYRVLLSLYPKLTPYVTAGLSLGEYSALYAAGKVSFAEGLRLVAQRASLMQTACSLMPGSMQVVLGMEEAKIMEIFSSLNPPPETLCIANINCPGQIVIAGSHADLEIGALALKNGGAKRILPLEVSGAFHSKCMESARAGLAPFIEEVVLQDTPIRFVMNTPGAFVQDPQEIRSNLLAQVVAPVRWQKGIEAMLEQGITHFIEIGPGKTLQGMNKRIGVQAPTVSLEKVEDLLKIEEIIHAIT